MRLERGTLRTIVLISTLLVSVIMTAEGASSSKSLSSEVSSSIVLQGLSNSPVVNYPINTSNSVPNAIITGANNHTFWFTEFGAGKIGEFDSSKGVVTHEYPVGPGAMPATVAIDQNGLIWFTDENQNSPGIWSLNSTTGTFTHFPTGMSSSDPIFVLVDSVTNNVWFTDYYGNYVGEIAGSSHVMTKHLLPSANSYPVEMAKQNGTNYLWITEATGKVARFDMSTGATVEFNPSVPISYPVGIAVGRDGNVWVSEHGGSSVTEFMPSNSTWRKYPTSQATSNPGTGVATLAMDQNGRLWFAEHYSNRIGRLDPASGEIVEFDLPIPGAYSLLDTVDSRGNFWFTEATANQIGIIPRDATSNVTVQPVHIPKNPVTAGSSTQAAFAITNNNTTRSLTLTLSVTSSFTTNYYTTTSEVSLSNYTMTLGPGETGIDMAVLTPDFSLPSAIYAAGIVASYGNVSSVGTVFLSVSSNDWYVLETLIPEILIAAAAGLLLAFLFVRQRKMRRMKLATSLTRRTTTSASMIALLFATIAGIEPVWGKCPGLPPPPGSGPDPYGIALDIGSVAFFALVAYFLIRSRLRTQNPPP